MNQNVFDSREVNISPNLAIDTSKNKKCSKDLNRIKTRNTKINILVQIAKKKILIAKTYKTLILEISMTYKTDTALDEENPKHSIANHHN